MADDARILRELRHDRPEVVASGLRRLVRAIGHATDLEISDEQKTRRKALEPEGIEARLLQLSQRDNAMVRELAVDALGAWRTEAARDRLMTMVEDEDVRVRASVIGALAPWVDEEEVGEACLLAFHDLDWQVRMRAVLAVAAGTTTDAKDALLEALVDEDGLVRNNAAEILKTRADERVLERVRKYFDYPNPQILDAALGLLGEIGDESDRKFLRKVGAFTNFSQPAYIKRWARDAAKRIKQRQRQAGS